MKILPATFIVVLLALIFSIAPVRATTWTVTSTADDGSAGTLRTMIGEASAGDMIEFDPTLFATEQTITETRGSIFIEAGVIVQGPPAGVVIAGGSSTAIVNESVSGENPASLIGLTVQNSTPGFDGYAAGVWNDGVIVLTDCIIRDCTGAGGSGFVNGGVATLTNCTLSNNSAQNAGGAILNSGIITLDSCSFTGNSADEGGGGLFNYDTATLLACSFSGNSGQYGCAIGIESTGVTSLTNCTMTGNSGVALYVQSGTVTLEGCTISNNVSTQWGAIENGGTLSLIDSTISGNSATANGSTGGGVFDYDVMTAVNCTFSANSASSGAGISNYGSAMLTNCTIAENLASPGGQGGGVYNNGELALTNCTVTGNAAAGSSGGLYGNNGSTTTLVNDIIYGDTTGGEEVAGAAASASNCDIEGLADLVNASLVVEGPGDFDLNPQLGVLQSNGGPVETCALAAGSACYGAGAEDAAPSVDARGVTRPNPPSVGAYDFGVTPLGTLPTPIISPAGGSVYPGQLVTITDASGPAAIYYTSDGATPTVESPRYTGAILVEGSETIKAIASGVAGYYNSAVASVSFSVTPTATPTLSPVPTSFIGSITVSLSDATAGSAIYYSLDGSTPQLNEQDLYVGPITLYRTTTITAFAQSPGVAQSATTSGVYTLEPVAAPIISPSSQSFVGTLPVSISDVTPGATIYYTLDGLNYQTYASAFSISSTETVSAFAIAAGYANSPVTTQTYTGGPTTSAPTFSLPPGSFASATSVTLSDTTPNASIYYTLDGSTPTISSLLYSQPLQVAGSETISAIAVAPGDLPSQVAMAAYAIQPVSALVVNTLADSTDPPGSGTVSLRDAIGFANAHSGSTITFESGLSGDIVLSAELIAESNGTTISGPGPGIISVDGSELEPIFPIFVALAGTATAPIAISGLTFQNGQSGIVNEGFLTITDCAITGFDETNEANAAGGILNLLTLTLTGCTVSDDVKAVSGQGLGGGGLLNLGGLVTIVDCSFANDDATNGEGGAIYNAPGGTMTMSACSFAANSGGAIFDQGASSLTSCSFIDNVGSYGGALYSPNSDLTACAFIGNQSGLEGGAVAVENGDFQNCTFSGNSTVETGGGILTLGPTTLANCTLTYNSSQVEGGAMEIEADATLVNCTFEYNTSVSNGGVINDPNGESALAVENCTFTGNSLWGTDAVGGAMAVNGPLTLTNDILYGDSVPGGEQELVDYTTANVTFCDIGGGWPGTGNINQDPLLIPAANNGGPVETCALGSGSPCYGAGTASGAPIVDARGVGRPSPPSMGAYDFGLALGTLPAPSITPGTSTVYNGQLVTITDSNSGASILYTTDGTTPSLASILYTTPFTDVATTPTSMVSAIASGVPGYYASPVCSATYTYNAGYEGDVLGHGTVDLQDWVDVGRIVVDLAPQPTGMAYMAADCSPRSSLGSGVPIGLADWVQVGRYVVGLDPLTPIGGPTSVSN